MSMKSLRQFIYEEIHSIKSELDSMGIDHHISHNPTNKTTTVSKIVVPKDKRNSGVGSKAMRAITNHADKHGHRLVLTPSADFGGSVGRLKSFYKRHGFIENKGKNKDFSTRETMYRSPR